MQRKFLIFLVLLCCFSRQLPAQEKYGESAAWNERSQAASDSFAVPKCSKTDQSSCNQNCNTHFDDDFKSCVDSCMKGRCVKAVDEEEEDKSKQNQEILCVEEQSASCDKGCSRTSGAALNRCRRACLTEKCPKADALITAKEGADPGILRCEQCRAEYTPICSRQCALGRYRAGAAAGLINLGCEKTCIFASCSKSCGTRPPI